jgi:precorrin-6B C5,15-methyltransferase / cobalt-precorrin-6B C5,C15-methyltransferase
MAEWLSIVGIGDDGWESLSPSARACVCQAKIIVGGKRHLQMLPVDGTIVASEQITWENPIAKTIADIQSRRGESVCILASGDPTCYGIATTLGRHIPPAEMKIFPAPSAFSLARARLGWSFAETNTLSLCGRDRHLLIPLLAPHARILILSADRTTPFQVAELLIKKGYGQTIMTVLCHIGGQKESIVSHTAAAWIERSPADIADLNTIAIECLPSDSVTTSYPVGLSDSTYIHDGQLTKREIRALTVMSLSPQPGELLWDVGAGCGSIGIEWMRSHRHCRAIAIESHPQRREYIATNAANLGVPNLNIVAGIAPAALAGLPPPDAIFIGGGLTAEGVFTTCWEALKDGGRLVANAVTVESELRLFELQKQWGGELTRLNIQRTTPIGKFQGWQSLSPITQWAVSRSC